MQTDDQSDGWDPPSPPLTAPQEIKVIGGLTPAPEWRYEMRRHSQEILPGLFVGPFQAAKNKEALQKDGITHVLCIADPREQFLLRPYFPGEFEYKIMLIRDSQDQNLVTLFPECREFITSSRSQGGKVLVHCGDGISRSPAIVTAYVMVTENIPYEEAFDHVQSRRFCASPNPAFHHQIEVRFLCLPNRIVVHGLVV
ncbi:phosphatases II [Atractiella rhizophila]|nr:phosphatases II [Atractiella rhizophila]